MIDKFSEMSGHEDVLIYDALSSPVYRYTEENQIISADAIASVVEVKSVLNKKELENGFEKISQVKRPPPYCYPSVRSGFCGAS